MLTARTIAVIAAEPGCTAESASADDGSMWRL